MAGLLYPSLAVAAWLAAGYRLVALARGGRAGAGRAAVLAALILLAVTFTVSTPAVWAWLDRHVAVHNLAALAAHLCVVGFSATVQLLVLWWVTPPPRLAARLRLRLAVLVVVVAVLVSLFLTAGPTQPHTTDFVVSYAPRPQFAAYLLVYLASFALGLVDVIRLCWPYARVAGRAWLRRGLRTTAAGALAGLVYCGLRAADVLAAATGADPRRWEPLVSPAASLGALLVIAGLTMPAWGPRLSRVAGWWRMARAYRRIGPLWRALRDSYPGIALAAPVGRGLSGRLYRRVIEVYDGRLALRPALDDAVGDRARELGRQAGLTGAELDAVVEAAKLRAALANPADGPAPLRPERPTPAVEPVDGLAGEAARLALVATAFARSPVVAAAVQRATGGAAPHPVTDPGPR